MAITLCSTAAPRKGKMNWSEPARLPDDRRTRMRFSIQAPVIATIGDREVWAFTRSISARAIYLCAAAEEEAPTIGDSLIFLIKVPPSLSFPKPCFIKGHGLTTRVDHLEDDQTGIVVEILDYTILSQTAAERAAG
ncbi:hypothetical protein DYQ86_20735 [Acidobacteria bacterium AB60]|nr:hypothetical protein DYQ86_20735 [Acidobacteria bacterium AB60]